MTLTDRLHEPRPPPAAGPRLGFLAAVIKKFVDDQAGQLAALIAYYAFVSLFPLLLVLVTVLGFVLAGRPRASRQPILNGTLGQFPIICDQLKTPAAHRQRRRAGDRRDPARCSPAWVSRRCAERLQPHLARASRPPQLPPVAPAWPRRLAVLGTSCSPQPPPRASSAPAARARRRRRRRRARVHAQPAPCSCWPSSCSPLSTVLARPAPGSHRRRNLLAAAPAPRRPLPRPRAQAHGPQLYGIFALVLGLLAWLYLGAQLTIFAAEINVVRKRRLWPRSFFSDPCSTPTGARWPLPRRSRSGRGGERRGDLLKSQRLSIQGVRAGPRARRASTVSRWRKRRRCRSRAMPAAARRASPTRSPATGPIDLMFMPGWISQVEQMWESPAMRRWLESVASFARLIMYDRRGTGLSDRVGATHTPRAGRRGRDRGARRRGSERAALFAYALGVRRGCSSRPSAPNGSARWCCSRRWSATVWAPDYEWAHDARGARADDRAKRRRLGERSRSRNSSPRRGTIRRSPIGSHGCSDWPPARARRGRSMKR